VALPDFCDAHIKEKSGMNMPVTRVIIYICYQSMAMAKNKPSLYLISILLFMLLLPTGCIFWEYIIRRAAFGWPLTGKWFLFWAVGVRLFIAGIRQATNPAFTAKEIFHLSGEESFPIIKELGFANICMGLISILSLWYAAWRMPTAVAGGLYFGLAAIMHMTKKPASRNELIALVSDLFIFIIMLGYLVLGS
jgi:hypothetical protein